MGLIYPASLVLAGRIPRRLDYLNTRDQILEELGKSPVIESAAIFGSVARGDFTNRSDLDLIVICKSGAEVLASRILRRLRWSALDRDVVCDIKLLSVTDAMKGNHKFGPSYVETLRKIDASSCRVGVPMTQLFLLPEISIAQEMHVAIQKKYNARREQARAFPHNAAFNSLDEWLYQLWRKPSRPLYLPFLASRWLVWWRDGCLENESRPAVFRSVLNDPLFGSMHDPLRGLIASDRSYGKLLGRFRRRKVTREQYLFGTNVLLKQCYRESVRLLKNALEFIREQEEHAA